MNKTTHPILIAAAILAAASACTQKKTYDYPFRDPSLPTEERVENLISLLTPEEKVGLMMNKSVSIDRLGIPSYNWWSEACHGVRQDGYTVYPQAIGLAATFNPELVKDVFSTVSDEARANWNRSDNDVFGVGMGETYYPGNPGLSFWCPNINIFRDPRWGRGQETSGEDPYLNSVMGVMTVKGMQGDDKRYYKTHACAKHYAVHSGPERLRHSMDVSVSNRDLWETYLPAFKALVKEADVREVMCAYQRFDGEPCCMNGRLLQDILRDKWGYTSLVVTDCDAINNFFTKGQHETHPDAVSAGVDAVLNGTDLECGKTMISLLEALEKGLIKESDLDVHLRRTLRGRFELGMFDPQEMLPWAKLGEDVISCEKHARLAEKSAEESFVLLKNEAALPLPKNIGKLAVVGPNADDVELLNGNYGGTPTEEHKLSILEGIRQALPGTEIIYDKACEIADDYNTTPYGDKFNDGKGLKIEFYNNLTLSGGKAAEGYYTEPRFSTFGAYGFADGVSTESLSLRAHGSFTADFSGALSYRIGSDNGYRLSVNGKLIDSSTTPDRGFFRPGASLDYKSFEVKEGETYEVEITYSRGKGSFASFNANFCRRDYADFIGTTAKAADADAIVVVGGISARFEGEGGDKADIELPAVQQRLLKAMHDTGKKVIFLNCSGSAIGFESVEPYCDAILQLWYAGQGGGKAVARTILGESNPSGKLPVTFYASTAQLPDFLDYSMEGRTYRYFRGEPLYPFGFGLSYTSFSYGTPHLDKTTLKTGEDLCVSVTVSNTGKMDGDETVQVYVKSLDDPDAPIKSLKGFKKVSIPAGKSKTVKITLDSKAFEFYDASIDELAPRAGRYRILCGSSSADADLQGMDITLN